MKPILAWFALGLAGLYVVVRPIELPPPTSSTAEDKFMKLNVTPPAQDYAVEKTDAEWRAMLTEEEYQILRQKGTERAFTGEYWNHKEDGVYACKGCGTTLFTSATKFDSHCGWPSFFDSVSNTIDYHVDNSYGMRRIEIVCKTCGGHLGHVFDDGPSDKGGLRYCVNSASIAFRELEKLPVEDPANKDDQASKNE